MSKKMTKGTVSFLVRKDKINSEGKAPVILNYSLLNQRVRLSLERNFKTDLKIAPYLFDTKTNRAVFYNKPDAKKVFAQYCSSTKSILPFDYDRNFLAQSEVLEYNGKLEDLIKSVKDCEDYFEIHRTAYSSTDVIDRLKVLLAEETYIRKEETKHYISDYIKKQLDATSTTANRNTLKNQTTMYNHLVDYEGKNKTEIANINRHWMQSFFKYLTSKGLMNDTAQTHIAKLKTFLNLARKDGYNIDLGYKDFMIKSTQLEVIALSFKEFNAIKDLNLTNGIVKIIQNDVEAQISYKTLEKARDIFVFGCLTGLRYSDLENLKRENIKDGFLSITVVKTKRKLQIPLIGMAYDILAKYESYYKPLPTLSNQKMNIYIKEVAKLAGIDEQTEIIRFKGVEEIRRVCPKYELISAHTARKTFITVSLELGMSAEDVKEISGHSHSSRAFARYVNITKERAKKAMNNAWEQPKLKIVG